MPAAQGSLVRKVTELLPIVPRSLFHIHARARLPAPHTHRRGSMPHPALHGAVKRSYRCGPNSEKCF